MRANLTLFLIPFFILTSCKCLKSNAIKITKTNSISVLQLRLLYESYLKDKIESSNDRASLSETTILSEGYFQEPDKALYNRIASINCKDIEYICRSACDEPCQSFRVKPLGKCRIGACPTRLSDLITKTFPNPLGIKSVVIRIVNSNTNELSDKVTLSPNALKTNLENTYAQELTNIKTNVHYDISVVEYSSDNTNISYKIPNVIFNTN